jgi:tRNA-Thr(GGU) m(6)t(6)A37 methyltransferase TsaA
MPNFEPIGKIVNSKKLKFDAPYQPQENDLEIAIIELEPNFNFEQALADLEGFDYIWILWWFHQAKTWKPKVRPPRGEEIKRGVFATRSPHRPNPIGLTAVPLIAVKNRSLYIGRNDLIDGTPILDIKPYLKSVDSYPQASDGWIAEIEEEYKNDSQYTLSAEDIVYEQNSWLAERGINFLERAKEILLRDPLPNRTRRIQVHHDDLYRIACGAWRIYYKLSGFQILLIRIEPGFPMEILSNLHYTSVPYREEQLLFRERFGSIYID